VDGGHLSASRCGDPPTLAHSWHDAIPQRAEALSAVHHPEPPSTAKSESRRSHSTNRGFRAPAARSGRSRMIWPPFAVCGAWGRRVEVHCYRAEALLILLRCPCHLVSADNPAALLRRTPSARISAADPAPSRSPGSRRDCGMSPSPGLQRFACISRCWCLHKCFAVERPAPSAISSLGVAQFRVTAVSESDVQALDGVASPPPAPGRRCRAHLAPTPGAFRAPTASTAGRQRWSRVRRPSGVATLRLHDQFDGRLVAEATE